MGDAACFVRPKQPQAEAEISSQVKENPPPSPSPPKKKQKLTWEWGGGVGDGQEEQLRQEQHQTRPVGFRKTLCPHKKPPSLRTMPTLLRQLLQFSPRSVTSLLGDESTAGAARGCKTDDLLD